MVYLKSFLFSQGFIRDGKRNNFLTFGICLFFLFLIRITRLVAHVVNLELVLWGLNSHCSKPLDLVGHHPHCRQRLHLQLLSSCSSSWSLCFSSSPFHHHLNRLFSPLIKKMILTFSRVIICHLFLICVQTIITSFPLIHV